MAESKKTKKTASPKAAAAKSGAAKGDTKKAAAKPATPAMPMMDTSLAAEAAARMVKHGLSGQGTPEAAGEKQESSAFRQLKQNLSKPGASGVAGFLQSTAPQKKSNLPFAGPNQQVRRNQTFGADVNRTGVPRRTGG